MRNILVAGAAVASLLGADAANAGERMVQRGPGMSHAGWNAPRPQMHPQGGFGPQAGHRAPRWGSKVGGRWWGGANAPGGWGAYRRPVRGWAVPTYWNSPRFYVSDWSTYGLQQPQYGYHWVRYYDDAVLIDGRGSVYDTVGGLDWDRYDGGYDQADYGYDDGVYANDRYAPPPAPAYRDDRYAPTPAPTYRDDRDYDRYGRRDNGVGGAVAGAAVGGVAGALIGGRGNRLGGALIGGGVGALTGYAIDKAEDRGRGAPPPPPPAPRYGADYDQPGYAYPAPRPYRPAPVAPGGHWVSPDGGTTVVTSGGGWGGSTTTVTVQTAPVVTTTTTEIYEDNVTWSRPARKVRKAKRKVVCACR